MESSSPLSSPDENVSPPPSSPLGVTLTRSRSSPSRSPTPSPERPYASPPRPGSGYDSYMGKYTPFSAQKSDRQRKGLRVEAGVCLDLEFGLVPVGVTTGRKTGKAEGIEKKEKEKENVVPKKKSGKTIELPRISGSELIQGPKTNISDRTPTPAPYEDPGSLKRKKETSALILSDLQLGSPGSIDLGFQKKSLPEVPSFEDSKEVREEEERRSEEQDKSDSQDDSTTVSSSHTRPEPNPTSKTRPLCPSTSLPAICSPYTDQIQAEQKTRHRTSSLTSIISSLTKRYTTSIRSAWVPVGYGSDLPQRQVIIQYTEREDSSTVRNSSGAVKGEQNRGWVRERNHERVGTISRSSPSDATVRSLRSWKERTAASRLTEASKQECDEHAWDNLQEYDPVSAAKSWEGWEFEEPVDEGEESEELVTIADGNAKALEAANLIQEGEENSVWSLLTGEDNVTKANIDGQNVLGLSEDDVSALPTTCESGLRVDTILPVPENNDEEPLNLFELPSTSPVTKTIDFRHIVHLLANKLKEPIPERIIHYSALQRIINVAGVDFNSAILSIMMEAQEGPLRQTHYTDHEIYSWYKATFRRKLAETDTLQALLLGMIQMATGRMLGESEQTTLLSLHGSYQVHCAIPLGYCPAHNGRTVTSASTDSWGTRACETPDFGSESQGSSSSSCDTLPEHSLVSPPLTPSSLPAKGKGRMVDPEPEGTVNIPPRPSSALPVSSTQYSVFPRVLGMVSKKLQTTTELVMLHRDVDRALQLAGISCQHFQEIMFQAQEFDEEEKQKSLEECEFEPEEGMWRPYRYYDALNSIEPMTGAQHVQDLPAFQRAIIYLLMLCFEWREDAPEEFVDRLSAEHSTLIDHTPYKLPVTLSSVSAESPKTRTIHAPWSRGESWEEQARMTILQIGPSTKVWE